MKVLTNNSMNEVVYLAIDGITRSIDPKGGILSLTNDEYATVYDDIQTLSNVTVTEVQDNDSSEARSIAIRGESLARV